MHLYIFFYGAYVCDLNVNRTGTDCDVEMWAIIIQSSWPPRKLNRDEIGEEYDFSNLSNEWQKQYWVCVDARMIITIVCKPWRKER